MGGMWELTDVLSTISAAVVSLSVNAMFEIQAGTPFPGDTWAMKGWPIRITDAFATLHVLSNPLQCVASCALCSIKGILTEWITYKAMWMYREQNSHLFPKSIPVLVQRKILLTQCGISQYSRNKTSLSSPFIIIFAHLSKNYVY